MLALIVGVLPILVALCAPAAAVVVDERVVGDRQQGPGGDPILLEPGQNRFVGTLTSAFVSLDPAVDANDRDSWLFSIAPGQQLTSIGLAVTTVTDSEKLRTLFWEFGRELADGRQILGLAAVPTAEPAQAPIFANATPRGPGLYNLFSNGFGGELQLGDVESADYTFTLHVTPLPIPAVGLAAALLGLAGLHRLRRRQAGDVSR